MKTECILFGSIGKVALGHFSLPEPGPDEAVVQSLYSCISPGTETRILNGDEPGYAADAFPLIPGYGIVGRIIAVGHRKHQSSIGTTVLCAGTAQANLPLVWGGHVAAAVAKMESLISVAPTTAPASVILCHIAGIAQRGVRLSKAKKQEAVVVIGLGLLGQLAVRLYTHAGIKVHAAGRSDYQVAAARRGGAHAVKVEPESLAPLRELLPEGADVIVDATGRPSALRLALDLIRPKPWTQNDSEGPRLVVLGSHPGDLTVSHHQAFQSELTLLWPRYTHRSDIEEVLTMVEKQKLDLSDLIGATVAPPEAPEIYQRLAHSRKDLITAAIRWAEIPQLSAKEAATRSPFLSWLKPK